MYTRDQPSPAYLESLHSATQFHRIKKKFEGLRTLRSYHQIKSVFEKHEVRTALDYGCGKGWQHERRDLELPDGKVIPSLAEGLGVTFTLYDPCWPRYRKLPTGQFDAVLVVDVLEYVPDEDISWVLREIFQYATRVVYIVASTIKPNKLVKEDYYRLEDWWLKHMVQTASKFDVDWYLRLRIKSKVHCAYANYGDGYCDMSEDMDERSEDLHRLG